MKRVSSPQPLRFLLCGAVNTAAAGGDAVDGDGDNLPVRESGLELLSRPFVGFWVAELLENDGVIANVIPDVAGREIFGFVFRADGSWSH